MAWGLPMLSLGYSVFVSIINMGDDPKCWVGWDNLVKWHFFIPLLAGAAVGNILLYHYGL